MSVDAVDRFPGIDHAVAWGDGRGERFGNSEEVIRGRQSSLGRFREPEGEVCLGIAKVLRSPQSGVGLGTILPCVNGAGSDDRQPPMWTLMSTLSGCSTVVRSACARACDVPAR